MGVTKFEHFFRAAGKVSVDHDDLKRYPDFVNEARCDLLIMARPPPRPTSGTSSSPGICRSPRGGTARSRSSGS
jgi:hypothetical protein